MGVEYLAIVECERSTNPTTHRLEAVFDLGKAYTTSAAMSRATATREATEKAANVNQGYGRRFVASLSDYARAISEIGYWEQLRGEATPAELLAGFELALAEYDDPAPLRNTERAMLAWLREHVAHPSADGRFRVLLFADS